MMRKNRGYITIEASLIVPLFLFFMLAMAEIYMIWMAQSHIHQALAAATDDVAQRCYIEKTLNKNNKDSFVDIENLVSAVVIQKRFKDYLGEDPYVTRVIEGGKNGIFITVKKDKENVKIMLVKARYKAKINLPLPGTHSITLSNLIKQKAFVGFSEEESIKNGDYYVFVTPNREAYHLRRDCTHLLLDVCIVGSKQERGYTSCYYCGKTKSQKNIYIAKNGRVYHTKRDCIGLKRTVNRVKISKVKGLGACERCGG